MRKQRGRVFINLGLLLVAAALFLTLYNVTQDRRAQRTAGAAVAALKEAAAQKSSSGSAGLPQLDTTPDFVRYPEMEMPVETVAGQDYIGTLEIPAIRRTLPVISQWSYPSLYEAPCRYTGSAYSGDLVIAAHNYSSQFASLRRLQTGDEVRFTDVDGNVFVYAVVLTETLAPTAVEEMTAGEYGLTLFTCTYGGSYRITVRCDLAETIVASGK